MKAKPSNLLLSLCGIVILPMHAHAVTDTVATGVTDLTAGTSWADATAPVGNYQPMKATVTPGPGSEFFRVEGSEN